MLKCGNCTKENTWNISKALKGNIESRKFKQKFNGKHVSPANVNPFPFRQLSFILSQISFISILTKSIYIFISYTFIQLYYVSRALSLPFYPHFYLSDFELFDIFKVICINVFVFNFEILNRIRIKFMCNMKGNKNCSALKLFDN